MSIIKQIKLYLCVIILYICNVTGLPGSPPTTIERIRSYEVTHDKLNILLTSKMYTDQTDKFITMPNDWYDVLTINFMSFIYIITEFK